MRWLDERIRFSNAQPIGVEAAARPFAGRRWRPSSRGLFGLLAEPVGRREGPIHVRGRKLVRSEGSGWADRCWPVPQFWQCRAAWRCADTFRIGSRLLSIERWVRRRLGWADRLGLLVTRRRRVMGARKALAKRPEFEVVGVCRLCAIRVSAKPLRPLVHERGGGGRIVRRPSARIQRRGVRRLPPRFCWRRHLRR